MRKKVKRVKNFFSEFKTFIARGNVLDMAVGVIVGGAFTGIVNGLSNYILKPLINWFLALLLGKEGLTGAITMLYEAYTTDESGVQIIDLANSIYIDWGSFISAIINFLIVAFVLFMIVRTMNRIAKAHERMLEGLELDEKKEIFKIRKEQRVSRKAAIAIYEAKVEHKQFFQGILHMGRIAALDNALMKFIGGVKDHLIVVHFQNFRLLKKGGNDGGGQLLFQIIDDLRPCIRSSGHNRLLSTDFHKNSGLKTVKKCIVSHRKF